VTGVGPNFIARPYRGVSVQEAGSLDEADLRAWLVGRPVYRRTEFIVAVRDCERAVVQVTHDVGDAIVAPVRDIRVLASPDVDWRWGSWYANTHVCTQDEPGNWFGAIAKALEVMRTEVLAAA